MNIRKIVKQKLWEAVDGILSPVTIAIGDVIIFFFGYNENQVEKNKQKSFQLLKGGKY
jgi:hypothetical protein